MEANTFRTRRQRSLALTGIALAVVVLIVWIQETRLAHTSFLTGTLLLASVLLLVLLGVRKRIPVLALGSVSTWTHIHTYVGLFSIGVYLLHVPSVIGNGLFESGLSILFLLVAASGFYGLIASRTIPKQLTAIDGEKRFDQIPWHRDQIALKAEQLLSECAERTSSGVIERLYKADLGPYFSSRPSTAYLLSPSGRRRRRLLRRSEGDPSIRRIGGTNNRRSTRCFGPPTGRPGLPVCHPASIAAVVSLSLPAIGCAGRRRFRSRDDRFPFRRIGFQTNSCSL